MHNREQDYEPLCIVSDVSTDVAVKCERKLLQKKPRNSLAKSAAILLLCATFTGVTKIDSHKYSQYSYPIA
jgi:hypothetical protein